MKKSNKHFHDKVMAFTLDNIIRRLFVNPVRLLEKMGVKEGQKVIDIVIIIDTIADLSDSDSVLKEMNRILKSDGILSVYEGLFGHWKPEKVQNVI